MATLVIYTVKLGIQGLTPEQLVERGRAHVDRLTANPNFPPPTIPTTASITAACDALEAANLDVVNNGGRQDRLIQRERARDLRRLLKELAGYVQAQSTGDPEKIASAGFETRKTPEPIGTVAAPPNMRARTNSLPGNVDLRWDGVNGKLIYQVWITSGDPLLPTGWSQLTMTGRNFHTATELTSGTTYSFRVNAVGASGPGPLSDHASVRAL